MITKTFDVKAIDAAIDRTDKRYNISTPKLKCYIGKNRNKIQGWEWTILFFNKEIRYDDGSKQFSSCTISVNEESPYALLTVGIHKKVFHSIEEAIEAGMKVISY